MTSHRAVRDLSERYVFRVYGTPAPQGSKRHVGGGVMVESSKRVKPWRQDVKYAALEALPSTGLPIIGPVAVRLTFWLPRPKGHWRTGRNAHLLRDSAPTFPATKPDVDKVIRSTLDALGEAGLWHDDAQVVELTASKVYAMPEQPPGARIEVEAL